MANYRTVSQYFWTDSKVDDDFTPEDKYFYLYLLTNPHTNICGCYEISPKQMSRETGYNVDTIVRLLERMERTHDVIRYSPSTKEVLLINWHKYNWSRSDKLIKAVQAVAAHIKNVNFKDYIFKKIEAINNTDNSYQIPDNRYQITDNSYQITDTEIDVSIPYGYGIDRVSEKEEKSADAPTRTKKSTAFIKPTIEEIAAYIAEKGYTFSAEAFFAHYESNGWKVGNAAMKSWKMACVTWQGNQRQYGGIAQKKQSTNDTLRQMYEDARRKDAENDKRRNDQNIDPAQAVLSDIYG